MTLLGKRCWIKTQKNSLQLRHYNAEETAIQRIKQLERKRANGFKKKLREAKEELEYKDSKLEESWQRYHAEVADKRQSQRDFRLYRSASQEMCKKHDELQKEIGEFRSNSSGFIKRSIHQELMTEHQQLMKEYAYSQKLVSAWKSQCGRFQTQNTTKE